MANEMAAQKSGTTAGRKPQILRFHPVEAKEFYLDKDEFVGFTFYKKVEIVGFVPEGTSEIGIVSIVETIRENIDRTLGNIKVPDMIVNNIDISKVKPGRMNSVFTCMIPYTGKTNLAVKGILRVVHNTITPELEKLGFSSKLRFKDMVRIRVNAGLSHQKSPNVFLKALTAVSHEDPRTNRENGEVIGTGKDYIKTAAFAASWAGFNLRDVITFNRYSLAMMKIMIYGLNEQDDSGDVYEYWIPYKKNLRIVTTQFESDSSDNPQFLARTLSMTLNLSRAPVIRGSNERVALGVMYTRKTFERYTDGLDGAIRTGDGKNLLTFRTGVDEHSPEMETFMADVSTIDSVLFASITKFDNEEGEKPSEEEIGELELETHDEDEAVDVDEEFVDEYTEEDVDIERAVDVKRSVDVDDEEVDVDGDEEIDSPEIEYDEELVKAAQELEIETAE